MSIIRLAPIFLALLIMINPAHADPKSQSIKAMPVPLFLKQRNAQIIDQRKIEGGLTIWIVRLQDGKRGVFYTTPDQTVMIAGTLFNAETGTNLSDKYFLMSEPSILAAPAAAATIEATPSNTTAAARAIQKDPIVYIRNVLRGVIDSNGVPFRQNAPIVYVFFDPLCLYCHKLYNNTRKLVLQGAVIKWLPVDALGSRGIPISSAMLRAGTKTLPQFATNSVTGVAPTQDEKQAISDNMLMATSLAFTVGKSMATPMMVYVERNGMLAVEMDDGSDRAVLNKIFWETAQ